MSRPAPLVPANVDLTDFPFMPLLIARLKQSRAWLMCKRRPELAFYMVNLWTASWHGRPAASLENDDDVLADVAMCPPKMWKNIRADVLRGWVECDDNRIYHPVVAEQALASWSKKVAQRQRTEAARLAKANRRGALSAPHEPAETEPSISPATERVTVSVTDTVTAAATASVTGSKGEGESRDRENPPIVPLPGDSLPRAQKRKAKPAGELCPEDFTPIASHYAKAAEWGRPAAWVDEQAERMKGWSRASANRESAWKSDWGQALHNWLREQHGKSAPILVPNGLGALPGLAGGAGPRPVSGPPSARVGIAAAVALHRGPPQ